MRLRTNIGKYFLARFANRMSNNIYGKALHINEEAYRLYLQGAVLADKRNRKDSRKSD